MKKDPIHDYFGVNINIIWRTIQEDIPILRNQVAELIDELI